MYKIIFREKWRNKLKEFIVSYKNSNLRLYIDTGIYYENLIRENYIKNSREFYYKIRKEISNILKEENILWFSTLENWNLETTTITWNYRLFIEYNEDLDNKLRFVENIRFFNK